MALRAESSSSDSEWEEQTRQVPFDITPDRSRVRAEFVGEHSLATNTETFSRDEIVHENGRSKTLGGEGEASSHEGSVISRIQQALGALGTCIVAPLCGVVIGASITMLVTRSNAWFSTGSPSTSSPRAELISEPGGSDDQAPPGSAGERPQPVPSSNAVTDTHGIVASGTAPSDAGAPSPAVQ